MFRMLKWILCNVFYECLRIQAEKKMEIESECNENISSESYLVRLKEEHGTMVIQPVRFSLFQTIKFIFS
jgi:hypothetical protein